MDFLDDRNTSANEHCADASQDSLRHTILRQEAALQAKSRLIDNMAYQIRTLSNAIIGFSDLLLCESMPPDHADYVTEINQAGRGLSDLVSEVLDWSSLESGRLRVAKVPCVLNDIVEQLQEDIRPHAEEKNLSFEILADDALPAEIVTDADRLLKCLKNLAANALQHTTEGFVNIHMRPETQDQTTVIRFDVVDSGKGIPPDKLESLFKPATGEHQIKDELITMLNLGLTVAAGLPLTHQLAELLGGTLEAQSSVGKGSTFSLKIPTGLKAGVSPSPCTPSTEATENPSPSRTEQAARPILVVEDQESNRKVVRLILQTMGFEAETAQSGAEALEMAMARPYSLIFMDLKMPDMDGCETTRRLRAGGVDVPIIALSALSLDARERKTIAELFDDFLSKPIDSEQMLKTIRRYTNAETAALNTTEM